MTLAFSQTNNTISNDIQLYSSDILKAVNSDTKHRSEAYEKLKFHIDRCLLDLPGAVKAELLVEDATYGSPNSNRIAEIVTSEPIEVSLVNEGISGTSSSFPYQALADWMIKSESRFLFVRYYAPQYFSYRHALIIDLSLEYLSRDSLAIEQYRNCLLGPILSSLCKIVSSVGDHFAQPMRVLQSDGIVKTGSMKKMIRKRKLDFMDVLEEECIRFDSLAKSAMHISYCTEDWYSCLSQFENEIGFIYADPPYTRDHYSRFYHILEAASNYRSHRVDASNARPPYSMYSIDRHQSPFCIRSSAPQEFSRLFSVSSAVSLGLALSYSDYDKSQGEHPRVVEVEYLVSELGKYYQNIDMFKVDGAVHSRFNAQSMSLSKSSTAELLIVGWH